MDFSIVIPTRGSAPNLQRILWCLSEQTVQPEHCILVVNWKWVDIEKIWDEVLPTLPKEFTAKLLWEVIASDHSLAENASFARNLGCSVAQTEFVYFLDDDNFFDSKFLQRSIREYHEFSDICQDKILYSPIIMWRDTDRIQSRGIKAFHFSLGRPEPVTFWWWKNMVVKMLRPFFRAASFYKETEYYTRVAAIGWNSLLAEKKLFEEFPFDEWMGFVFEDLDFSYRVTRAGVPLYVSKTNRIYHMEREKSKLEQSFLANAKWAYQKARNRVVFVRKNASLFKKILFILVAFPMTSVMMMLFIIFRGGKNRREILSGYWHGMRAWWTVQLEKSRRWKCNMTR